jgi:poly-beta-1,6-N-acetyl-D-glucosamine synthase
MKKDNRLSIFGWINLIAFAYALICFYLSQAWINELTQVINNRSLSIVIVIFIAIIPGYLNIMLLASLYFYKYEPARIKPSEFPPITVLIAAYNEEDNVFELLRGLKHQTYPSPVEILVIDDGSIDRTVERLEKANLPNLRIIHAQHGGKAAALNRGLQECKNDIIVTIDADTFLHRRALRSIVARLVSRDDYAAVAGDVLVKNERMSRLARLQAWDYMLGIASVKRQQSMFHGTLVAQGAFSAFRKKAVMDLKGWRDCIGEDIVLTWGLLKAGWNIGYEPKAFAFTNVPLEFKHLTRQRERWARGMIEGFKEHIDILWIRRDFSTYFIALDLLFPLIDLFYTFVFLPGLILALFGHFYIVGLFTLFVIPINICVILIMIEKQKRFLRYAGLKFRENSLGLSVYIVLYQFLMSPTCVKGYFQEFFSLKRKWK